MKNIAGGHHAGRWESCHQSLLPKMRKGRENEHRKMREKATAKERRTEPSINDSRKNEKAQGFSKEMGEELSDTRVDNS